MNSLNAFSGTKAIAILGAGNVGSALAQAFNRHGVAVTIGVPNPDKYRTEIARLGDAVSLTLTDIAIQAADLIILAVPDAAVLSIARSRPDWQGKILVDATNPLTPGLAGLRVGTTTSAAELLAENAKGARVVKAFNTTGAENLADTRYPGGLPFMPVCGDDAAARQQVMALATQIGFEAVDYGPLAAARYLEPLAMAWIHLAIKQGFGRNFAFGLLHRH